MRKSPSFLAISDVHIGLNLYNQPDLGNDLRRLFAEACQLAVSLQTDYLVIAGDLFDSNKPTPDLVHFVRNQIEDARLGGVKVVGIAGDHDKPVNTESWTRISGVAPVDTVPEFIGCDYSDNPGDITSYLLSAPHPQTVEWIFLHGQTPVLWPFCDERKKLELSAPALFERYPKLRGVILGDIHKPYEGKLAGPCAKEVYLGYCGSLGITSSTDIGGHLGLLHFDGTYLAREPLPLGRDFIKIDLTTSATNGLEVGFYVEKYKQHRGKQPVFLVEYSANTKNRLSEIRPLYPLGVVRTNQVRLKSSTGEQHFAVNIRSDMNNGARITQVLKDMVPDVEVRALIEAGLHTEDPKIPLDEFRRKYSA